MRGLDRLLKFRHRAIIWLGHDIFCISLRQQATDLALSLAADWDLDAQVEALNDPFFNSAATANSFWQRGQDLKFERRRPRTGHSRYAGTHRGGRVIQLARHLFRYCLRHYRSPRRPGLQWLRVVGHRARGVGRLHAARLGARGLVSRAVPSRLKRDQRPLRFPHIRASCTWSSSGIGQRKVIEAACRIGGDMISTITEMRYGVALEKCLARLRTGLDLRPAFRHHRPERARPDNWLNDQLDDGPGDRQESE